jgi:hypothetical protein
MILSKLLPAFCVLAIAYAQTATWTETDQSDQLHQTSFKEFSLEGKFLVAPQRSSLSAPVLVLRCQPGHGGKKSRTNGNFVEGWIAIGAVLNSTVVPVPGGVPRVRVPVEYRLDDKKLQSDFWNVSTDRSGVFVDDLDNLLYGHFLPHREGTNAQIRRIMLGVPEYLAVQIQMQFDLPDSTDVAEACGAIMYKRLIR